MRKTVHVNLGPRSYDILIGSGLLREVPDLFRRRRIHERLFLVSNTRVFELYGRTLLASLGAGGFTVTPIQIPEGEEHKTIETVSNIYTYLIAQRADRLSTVVALGGGVTGDVAGFVAATFMRGIPYVQLPTTLLAQVDSSVGGKTGVNHQLGKNMIGAFYQPNLVCIDTDTLASLPEREFQSGLYEVVKYGLIYDPGFFRYLEEHLDQARDRDPAVLSHIISRCCEIKAEVISVDEREQDLRRILNFGHTFGHALEAATRFRSLTHGEAIAYGMLAEARISCLLGLIDEPACERIVRVIHRVGPLPGIAQVPSDSVLEAMERDKKRAADRLHFVLLKEIGKTTTRADVPDRMLAEVWDEVSRAG